MGEQVAEFLAVRAPFAPALFFTLGIAVSADRPLLALTCAGTLLLVRAALEVRSLPGGHLALLLAWTLAGAGLSGLRLAPGAPPDCDDGEARGLEGVVESRAGAGAVLAVDRVGDAPGLPLRPASFRAALSGAPDALLAGERVRVLARLFRSRAAANPGEPDALERDRARGIDVHAVMRPDDLLHLAPAPAWRRFAQRVRARFEALAAGAISDANARALVVTLAVGDRSTLAPELNEHFNSSGLAHILSVSGLHIAVIALGLLAVLRWLLLRSTRLARRIDARRLAGLVALPALWAYVVLTGAEVPAVRSGLMASALVAARLVDREAEPFTGLSWAAILCLAWDPAQLHDLSFQLSFGAVLGLLTLARPLRELIPIAPPPAGAQGIRTWPLKAREWALSGACTSLAASLATAPIVAEAFHRESLVAVGANLLALPIASALTVVAALAAACTPVAPLASLLLHLASPLAIALERVADGFGALPFAAARVAAPSTLTVVLFYAALAALAFAKLSRRALGLFAASSLALVLLGAWRTARPHLERELAVTFLAVGQGDATFIRFPGGQTLLVDGGGAVGGHFDPGARIIAPFLWEQGLSRLDAVALSHPHPDHALGLIGLAPLVPTDALWLPDDVEPGGLIAELERANRVGEPDGARVRSLERGDALPSWGGARIEVLGPPHGAHFEKVNDQSLVLKITYGEVSILLPGDAEEDAERALLQSGDDLGATILKAPHHGSKTSSTEPFVRAVHPREVVFCVGVGNRFHFPAPSVQRRYADAHCELFRTDRDGAITFRTDGHSVRSERFLAGDWRTDGEPR